MKPKKGEGGALSAPAQQKLPTEVKRRIIVLFAQFQRVGDVQKMIEEEFGIRVHHRTLQNYDPERGRQIGKELLQLYEEARAAYVSDITAVGIAHQNHRLRILERLIAKAEAKGQYSTVASLLKQAAEEMGGVMTNVRRVEGNVGHVHMSIEDARQELALRLYGAIETAPLIEAKPLETNEKP